MRRVLSICLLAAVAPAAADPVPRPPQLGLCAACHGDDGRGRSPGIPHLNGQDEAYLVDALRQYRSGRRSESAMRMASGSLQDRDIVALARWYATRPVQASP